MVNRAIGEIAQFYGDKPSQYYDNSTWQEILDAPHIQKLEESSLYKTVIHTMWFESIGWHREIKTRWPQTVLLGLVDHPLVHLSRLPANAQHAFYADLEYLDGIMALTEEERQWYQTAVPSIPVERVGLPFPVEKYEEKYGNLRTQEREFIGLGVGAADNDRNFLSNIMAFRKLQLNNPDLVGVFLSVPEQLIPYCSYWADKVENVFIHQRNNMAEFYEMLARCKLVINLADRNTPGRLQGEAAFFDVPVIGTDRLELQRELFPSLATKSYELERVVELAEYLLDNPRTVENITSSAHQQLVSVYNYEESKNRFDRLMERVNDKWSIKNGSSRSSTELEKTLVVP